MMGFDAEKGLMNRKVIHTLPIRINIKRKNIYKIQEGIMLTIDDECYSTVLVLYQVF